MERLTDKDLLNTNYDNWELCGMDAYFQKRIFDKEGCYRGCHILKMYHKLAEYENLEEQGKLIKLPCKVGDTVYFKVQSGEYAEAEVRDFTYFLTCGFCIVVTSEKFGKQNIPFTDFGKTVFLTKEEAEAALKKMEGDYENNN